MPVLAITPDITRAAERVKAFAEDPAHWRRANQGVFVPGNLETFTVEIPIGYKAVYCIDYVNQPVRHLSVSVIGSDGQPSGVHPMAMMQLAELFGFGEDARMGTLHTDPPWVIHAIEVFDPDAS